jgi:hypothetical protein
LLTHRLFKFAAYAMFFSFGAALASIPACGALGEDSSSVQKDQAHMNASLHSTQRSGYILHELRLPSGAVVHEFASASGHVFTISWQGSSVPDLQQLLGSHFEDFQQVARAQQRRGVGGAIIVQSNGMVVELGGHMRDIRGRAYLVDQLPAGVRIEDLR